GGGGLTLTDALLIHLFFENKLNMLKLELELEVPFCFSRVHFDRVCSLCRRKENILTKVMNLVEMLHDSLFRGKFV
ncbi:MAG: hypothetical protein ABW185_28915, partial [Sedimenticola sp.]